MYCHEKLESLVVKLQKCGRNSQFYILKEMRRRIDQITPVLFNQLTDYIAFINDVELITNLLSYLGACMSRNPDYRQIVVKCSHIYEKAYSILSKNLPIQSRLVLNFLSALVYVEAVDDIYSIESKLANHAKCMVRISGCLRTMTQMFLSCVTYTDTWNSLCLCLSECCRRCKLNQNQCAHLIPLCIEKIATEQDWDIVALVAQSIIEQNPENCDTFILHRGLHLFNEKQLQKTPILQILNSVTETRHQAELSNSKIPELLYKIMELHGPMSEVGRWCSVCQYNLHKKVTLCSNKIANESSGIESQEPHDDIATISKPHTLAPDKEDHIRRSKHSIISNFCTQTSQNQRKYLKQQSTDSKNSAYASLSEHDQSNDGLQEYLKQDNVLDDMSNLKDLRLFNADKAICNQLASNIPQVDRINKNLRQLSIQNEDIQQSILDGSINMKMRALYQKLKKFQESKQNITNLSGSSIFRHMGQTTKISNDKIEAMQEIYNDGKLYKRKHTVDDCLLTNKTQPPMNFEKYFTRKASSYINITRCPMNCSTDNPKYIKATTSKHSLARDYAKTSSVDKGCQTADEDTLVKREPTPSHTIHTLSRQPSFDEFIPIAQSTLIRSPENESDRSKISYRESAIKPAPHQMQRNNREKTMRKKSPKCNSGSSRRHSGTQFSKVFSKFNAKEKVTKPEKKLKPHTGNTSLRNRLIRTFNDSVISIIHSVKAYMSPSNTISKSDSLSINDKVKRRALSVGRHNDSYSFTEYFNAREAHEREMKSGLTHLDATEQVDSLQVSKSNASVKACNTCNDTVKLKEKLADNEYLKETVKKLKQGLNTYGCNFSKIASTYWPDEKLMTPSVLYSLYNKLILK